MINHLFFDHILTNWLSKFWVIPIKCYLNKIDDIFFPRHRDIGEDEEFCRREIEGKKSGPFRHFFSQSFAPVNVNLAVLLRQVAVQLFDLEIMIQKIIVRKQLLLFNLKEKKLTTQSKGLSLHTLFCLNFKDLKLFSTF